MNKIQKRVIERRETLNEYGDISKRKAVRVGDVKVPTTENSARKLTDKNVRSILKSIENYKIKGLTNKLIHKRLSQRWKVSIYLISDIRKGTSVYNKQ